MHGERRKGKQITTSEHIEMNYELVKRRIASFKFLSREQHKMNSGLLTLQFKRGKCKLDFKDTRNTHYERKQNSYHSH
jgi:hypothetical protein